MDHLKKGIGPLKGKTAGAGNGVRTRDHKLGKLVLYQLSYARSVVNASKSKLDFKKQVV